MNNKLQKNNKITVCVFGEGAAQQGLFWEAINYSTVNKLPIVFICENNLYATIQILIQILYLKIYLRSSKVTNVQVSNNI